MLPQSKTGNCRPALRAGRRTVWSLSYRVLKLAGLSLLLSSCVILGLRQVWEDPGNFQFHLTAPFTIHPPEIPDLRTIHINLIDEVAGIQGHVIRNHLEQLLLSKGFYVVEQPEQASYRMLVKLQTVTRTGKPLGTNPVVLTAISGALEVGGGYQVLGLVKDRGGLSDLKVAAIKKAGWAGYFLTETGLEYYMSLIVHLKIDENIRQAGRRPEILESDAPLALTPNRQDLFLSTLTLQTTRPMPSDKDKKVLASMQYFVAEYLADLF